MAEINESNAIELTQSDSRFIGDLLRHEYQQFRDSGAIEIAPETIAVSVYNQLDPELHAPLPVRNIAICELVQIMRGICRARYVLDESEHESKQGNLFELQPRYPANREGREVYVLRDYLTVSEWNYNESRLRKEGLTKIRHADAILAHVAKSGYDSGLLGLQ